MAGASIQVENMEVRYGKHKPKAEAIGTQRGYSYQEPEEEPVVEPPPAQSAPKRLAEGVLERLDSIILEAVLLKQEILRSR